MKPRFVRVAVLLVTAIAAETKTSNFAVAQEQTLKLNVMYTCNGERLAVIRCRSEADDAFCSVQYPDRKGPATGGMTPELAERRGDVIKKLQACGALALTHRPTSPQPSAPAATDAEAYYQQGKRFYDAKEYAKSIEANKQAIALTPTMRPAYMNLGAAYYHLEQYPNALAAFQQAIRLKPDNANTHQWLGDTYTALERYQDAIRAYKQALALDSSLNLAHFRLGFAYYKLEQYQNALAEFQQALRLKPDDSANHYWVGVAYYHLEQYPKALEELQEAVRLKPQDAYSHYWIGEVYANGFKEYEKAIPEYLEARRLNPSDARNINQLGIAYDNLRQYENAMTAFKEAVRLKPDVALYQSNLGIAYLRMDKKEEALQVYKTLEAMDKAKAQVLYDWINNPGAADLTYSYYGVLMLESAYGSASELYHTINTSTNSPQANRPGVAPSGSATGAAAYLAQGDSFRKGKVYAKAIESYKMVAALKPDSETLARAHFGVGLSYASDLKWEEALPSLLEAVRLKPDYADVSLVLGITYTFLVRDANALESIRQALRSRPTDANTHY